MQLGDMVMAVDYIRDEETLHAKPGDIGQVVYLTPDWPEVPTIRWESTACDCELEHEVVVIPGWRYGLFPEEGARHV